MSIPSYLNSDLYHPYKYMHFGQPIQTSYLAGLRKVWLCLGMQGLATLSQQRNQGTWEPPIGRGETPVTATLAVVFGGQWQVKRYLLMCVPLHISATTITRQYKQMIAFGENKSVIVVVLSAPTRSLSNVCLPNTVSNFPTVFFYHLSLPNISSMQIFTKLIACFSVWPHHPLKFLRWFLFVAQFAQYI